MPQEYESKNVESLIEIIRDLRAENAALLEMLLRFAHLLPNTEEEKVIIPESIKSVGKKPWYIRQKELEKAFAKPKLSEISGIPEKQSDEEILNASQES